MNNFTPPNEFIAIQIEALKENDFDFVLDVASNIFDTSVICVSFLGDKKQWHRSQSKHPFDLTFQLSCYLIQYQFEQSDDIFTVNNPQEEFFVTNGISSITSKALCLSNGAIFGHISLLNTKYVELTIKEQNIFRTFAQNTISLVEQSQLNLEELIFERNQLKVLLSSTNDYIWCIDKNLNLISANKTYIEAIKKHTGETPKKGDYFLIKGIHSEELIENFKGHCERAFKGIFFTVDIHISGTKWYNEQWLELSFHPIIEKGQVEKLVINARNITKRKKDKEKLRKSKTQYEALFLSNPQPMWIYDIETLAFLEINEAAIRHYGYTREEFLKMTLLDIRPKKDAYKYLDHSNPNEELEDTQYEWRHIKKNGETISVLITTHGIKYQGRKARHVLINDITEQKLHLQLLEVEKANTAALINSTDDLVWSIDKDQRLVTANEAYLQLIKQIYDVTLKPGDYVNDFGGITDQTRKEWDALHQRVLQGDSFTYESYTPEVSSIWGSWTEIIFNPIIEGNEVRGAAMFGRNITKRKIVELELEANQRILLETSEIGRIGGWQFDIATQKVTWNSITKEIHEVASDYQPTFESSMYSYKEGESRSAIMSAVNKAIHSGMPYDLEVQIVTAKGRERWVRAKGRVELAQGKPIRLYGMIQDINDQKKHLGAIEAQNKQLREIAWMQSHVVRAPVARIMGIINLLNDFDSVEISKKELLQNILDSAYELDGIIRKINNTIQTDTTIF